MFVSYNVIEVMDKSFFVIKFKSTVFDCFGRDVDYTREWSSMLNWTMPKSKILYVLFVKIRSKWPIWRTTSKFCRSTEQRIKSYYIVYKHLSSAKGISARGLFVAAFVAVIYDSLRMITKNQHWSRQAQSSLEMNLLQTETYLHVNQTGMHQWVDLVV